MQRVVYQLLACSALLLANGCSVLAQSAIESAPTRSVYRPGAGPADAADAFAVTLNPASLGGLSGYTIGLQHHCF